MIAVVLDTNAIHRDAWLSSDAATKLLALAANGSCNVVYTEVVLQELKRQQFNKLQELHANATALTKTMSRRGEPMDAITANLSKAFVSIESRLQSDFDTLFKNPGVVQEPIPSDATEKLVRRDLERRRPFHEVEVGGKAITAGFRDAVIWESVLALLEDNRGYNTVVFVTQDKGFLQKRSGLHGDLISDLDRLGIDPNRVVAVKTVFDTVSRVKALVESSAKAAWRARLTTVATDAMLELIGNSVSMEMVYGGEYDYPDFVKFTTGPMDESSIDDIDQQTEFEFAEDEVAGIVTARAEAFLYLSGFVMKSDWYADDGDSVSIIEDWNDHYFHASHEAPVQVVVEIDVNDPTPQVVSIELHDVEHENPSDRGESSTSM